MSTILDDIAVSLGYGKEDNAHTPSPTTAELEKKDDTIQVLTWSIIAGSLLSVLAIAKYSKKAKAGWRRYFNANKKKSYTSKRWNKRYSR